MKDFIIKPETREEEFFNSLINGKELEPTTREEWFITKLAEKLNLKPDFNQNDETAYDYIENRPFYEDVKIVYEPLNIVFDSNNTEGLVCYTGSAKIYKVSDIIPTNEELKGITWNSDTLGEVNFEEKWEEIVEYGWDKGDYFGYADWGFYVIRKPNIDIIGWTSSDGVFPETGIYLWGQGNHTITSSIPFKTTKIDKKILTPNSFQKQLH